MIYALMEATPSSMHKHLHKPEVTQRMMDEWK